MRRVDFKIRTVDLNQKTVKLQIWDTSGLQRFQEITRSYFNTAHGFLLVFDVTSRQNFDNIRNWMRKAEQHGCETAAKVLVGNKCDLVEKRVVSTEEAQQLADELGMLFVEVSAKSGDSVQKAFFTLADSVMQVKWLERFVDLREPPEPESITITEPEPEPETETEPEPEPNSSEHAVHLGMAQANARIISGEQISDNVTVEELKNERLKLELEIAKVQVEDRKNERKHKLEMEKVKLRVSFTAT